MHEESCGGVLPYTMINNNSINNLKPKNHENTFSTKEKSAKAGGSEVLC